MGLVGWGGVLGIETLCLVLSTAMAFEFGSMTLQLRDAKSKCWALVVAVWILHFTSSFFPPLGLPDLGLAFSGLFAFYLFTAGRHAGEELLAHIRELVMSFFGLVYVGAVPLLLALLRSQEGAVPHVTILFFLLIWATDTGAYFTGLSIGRTKLFPVISPKKSVEGLVGGVVLAVAVAFAYRGLFGQIWTGVATLLTAIFVSLSSQVGDLCESFLKRAFHQKDSGAILPGHGGFLDRFDGFLIALPVVYACATLFSLIAL